MNWWKSEAGRWLADMLDGGAVCAISRLRPWDVTLDEEAGIGLRFAEEALRRASPALESTARRDYDLPVRLRVESHDETHDVRAVGRLAPTGQRIRHGMFGLMHIPGADTALGSDNLVGAVAVLALRPFLPGHVVRVSLWVGRDEDDDVDLVEPFDMGWWGDIPATPNILKWT